MFICVLTTFPAGLIRIRIVLRQQGILCQDILRQQGILRQDIIFFLGLYYLSLLVPYIIFLQFEKKEQ